MWLWYCHANLAANAHQQLLSLESCVCEGGHSVTVVHPPVARCGQADEFRLRIGNCVSWRLLREVFFLFLFFFSCFIKHHFHSKKYR